ncbi:Uncharacterised protein [Bordetella pertussis]|nr:Uncharacterised protein [Bordetella pertussis]
MAPARARRGGRCRSKRIAVSFGSVRRSLP